MKPPKEQAATPVADLCSGNNSRLERMAIATTSRIGSTTSLILHSIFFVGIFGLQLFGVSFNQIMLILTTVVSLEAIYLSIFIQMTVNRQASQIAEVGEDIDEIQGDVDEIQEDVEEIQEEAKEISEDVEGIQEDVEDIKENVEDLSDEIEKGEVGEVSEQEKILRIERMLEELLREIKEIKPH